jgi:hypothetical protein
LKGVTQSNGFEVGERISAFDIVLGVRGQLISISAGFAV